VCSDVAFERSEEVCAEVGVGRFAVAGSGGMTEYHCEVGGKMNFAEDLDWTCFGGGISTSFSVSSEPLFGAFVPLSEIFFSLGFDFTVGRGAASSFTFPSRFFFGGPACRSFKNVVTSAARVGYFNQLEDEKRSSRSIQARLLTSFVS